MRSANRRITVNSLILLFKLVVTSVIGLVLSRYVLILLGAEDFGLYNVVGGVVVLLNILNTSMVSTTYRYIAYEKGKALGNPNKVFNISFCLHVFFSILVVILSETLGVYYIYNILNVPVDKVADALFVFRVSVIAAIINMLIVPFQGLIIAVEKFAINATFDILRQVLNLFFVFLLFYFKPAHSLRYYSTAILLVICIISIAYVIYTFRNFYEIVRFNFSKDYAKYREMFSFSSWILFGAFAQVGKIQGASLIINYFFSTVLNASYAIANQVNRFIILFASNIGTAAIPQITKSYSAGDVDRSVDLVANISKYTFLIMVIISVPIFLEAPFLLGVWLKNIPEYTVVFTRLMIINALIESLATGLPALVQATGKIKQFQLILSLMSLSSLPLSFILFKLGAPVYTLLIVYAIVSLSIAITRLYLLYKIIKFDLKKFISVVYIQALKVLLFIIPFCFIYDFIRATSLAFSLVGITIAVLYTCCITYFIGLSPAERISISKQLKQIIYGENI